jgi:beta-phosphoglucomutase-like phosphatase (HAD superfamily)
MRFDAIAFNFDGIIVDSKKLSTAALVESLAEAGLQITLEEAIRDYGGKRWADVLTLIETQMGREMPETLIIQQYKRMSRKVILQVGTIPGVEAFLDLTTCVKRAIVAASEPVWISQTLSRFGLDHHFGENVFTTAKLTHDKPHPEVYTLATAKLGVEPRRMVAIEDHPVGVAAAVAAGVAVIGFVAGSHILPGIADEIRDAGARIIAQDYEDIADWIGL